MVHHVIVMVMIMMFLHSFENVDALNIIFNYEKNEIELNIIKTLFA
jgi:hypothetical protein